MKVLNVSFINVVAHGGGIKSASSTSAANPERPGSSPFDIEFDPDSNLFKITRSLNGKSVSKLVPLSNVACFEIVEEVKPASEVKKK